MAHDTGIRTLSFPTGGLMGASQMRAPLTEEVAVTMDIRGLTYMQSKFS